MPRPLGGDIKQLCCLTSVCLTSVAYIVSIHGAHSYWKQGALSAAGQACMGWSWTAACCTYKGGAYRGGLPPTACCTFKGMDEGRKSKKTFARDLQFFCHVCQIFLYCTLHICAVKSTDSHLRWRCLFCLMKRFRVCWYMAFPIKGHITDCCRLPVCPSRLSP